MAPINASHVSLNNLSSAERIVLKEFPVLINFFKFNDLKTFAHVFLLTKLANFLSIIPSFSFGYKFNNFFDIIRPITLSPKNSNFSLLISLF